MGVAIVKKAGGGRGLRLHWRSVLRFWDAGTWRSKRPSQERFRCSFSRMEEARFMLCRSNRRRRVSDGFVPAEGVEMFALTDRWDG